MKEQHNPVDKIPYFQYLDANILYGYAMIQKLPTHAFLQKKKVDNFTSEKIDKLAKKDKEEYILEVDAEYPKELHKNYNEIPFSTGRMEIRKVEKLTLNLKGKKTYAVHIKNLNQALKHVLKLMKMNFIIDFEQNCWMKPDIVVNT